MNTRWNAACVRWYKENGKGCNPKFGIGNTSSSCTCTKMNRGLNRESMCSDYQGIDCHNIEGQCGCYYLDKVILNDDVTEALNRNRVYIIRREEALKVIKDLPRIDQMWIRNKL